MIICEALVPPGGWHFPQEGAIKPLEGYSYSNILDVIRDWRIANGKPVGDVRGEFDRWFCANFPRSCQPGSPQVILNAATTVLPNQENRLTDRISVWLTRLYEVYGALPLSIKPEANRRALICEDCPNNIQWKNACPSCVSNLERLGAAARHNNDADHFRKLGACKILGQDNRTAVWADMQTIDNSDALPSFCWAKR